ncbi:hypothetical protein CHLRE_01g045426v5 [Chlamydomonas reinhardtii]|uniref:Uncharacterized protein n=1 Tax=Chlamydomonas reinhardtii TaxID=3055 RepID=A0A2K3E7P5_CHLRE|nr:uncharacterized protein CHLRE_01g045426v5 [Chlamydomonas reinhardtii]PNW88810.1 hypothetical protein CHLRE_01g045426v5 [Chlamydomonas reinhardtii]
MRRAACGSGSSRRTQPPRRPPCLQNRDVSAANVIRVLLLLKLMGFERPTKLQRPPWPSMAAGGGGAGLRA